MRQSPRLRPSEAQPYPAVVSDRTGGRETPLQPAQSIAPRYPGLRRSHRRFLQDVASMWGGDPCPVASPSRRRAAHPDPSYRDAARRRGGVDARRGSLQGHARDHEQLVVGFAEAERTADELVQQLEWARACVVCALPSHEPVAATSTHARVVVACVLFTVTHVTPRAAPQTRRSSADRGAGASAFGAGSGRRRAMSGGRRATSGRPRSRLLPF